MSKVTLYFNNKPVPKVITYAVDKAIRRTDVKYNANGDMLVDMVSRKYQLTVYLGMMSDEEYRSFMQETEDIFFTVTFYCPLYGEMTKQFFLKARPARMNLFYRQTPYYEATVLQLEEM